jgi:hypothetical protein
MTPSAPFDGSEEVAYVTTCPEIAGVPENVMVAATFCVVVVETLLAVGSGGGGHEGSHTNVCACTETGMIDAANVTATATRSAILISTTG